MYRYWTFPTKFGKFFLGTFILTFGGKATVLGGLSLASTTGEFGASQLTGAFGAGLAVMLALLVTASVSGGHINPCITFSWAVSGRFKWSKVPKYMLGQYLGAALGTVSVLLVYFETAEKFDVILASSPNSSHIHSELLYQILDYCHLIFDQFLASTFLLLAFSSIVLEKHNPGPLLMGLSVTGIILALGQNAGCAMNPALDLMCR